MELKLRAKEKTELVGQFHRKKIPGAGRRGGLIQQVFIYILGIVYFQTPSGSPLKQGAHIQNGEVKKEKEEQLVIPR